jgi:branched-chain amino acid transport system substrate-binding protein
MKRTAFSFAALATLALALSACTGADNTIRIGYIGPLTGDAASYGSDTLNAVRMHVDEINAAGGINGKKIQLIAEDGRCNAADSVSAAQKLVNVDKVLGIVGGQCSSETLAAAAVVEQAKVSLISPISSSPDVTTAGNYIFRVYPSDAYKGKVLANILRSKSFTKIAILTENTDFCQGIRKTVTANLSTGALVFDEQVDPGTKDYRSLLTRLKDIEFDALIINGQSDATNGEMMKQARELGMTQPFYGTDTADSATLYKNAPEAAEGMTFINTSSKLGDNGEGSFGAKFRAQFGEPKANLSFATLSYDALGMLADVLKTESSDTTKIRDALAAHPGYAGAAGTLKFDVNGDIIGVGYAVKQFKGGEIIELELVPAE